MFEKKEHQNSGTLGKDTINNWIIPFLSVENLIKESNQMFILMKNCTKIGLKLNKQMVGLTDIKV
ncbi:hypothetical protein [Capnocytophaga sp. oral taxon 878]|uniref:hypothetical protein n=1 Tax=Capnocytophaga sp. oral taxon 878 TaxID=1316596 RepID=UPI00157D9B3C|nr:hypothetical protein [Capnocytophaga sp. oral taxon 878]